MPFLTPQFPTTADVYRFVGGAYVLQFATPCAFRTMIRDGDKAKFFGGAMDIATGLIYVPKLTDVRAVADRGTGSVPDMLVVPSGGTSRYRVMNVGDQAKGFPNEFRVVWVEPINAPVDGPHS